MRQGRRSATAGREAGPLRIWETLEERTFLSVAAQVAAVAVPSKVASAPAAANAVAPVKASAAKVMASSKPLFHTRPIAPRKPVVGTLAKPPVKAKSPAPQVTPPATSAPAPGAPVTVDYRLKGDANRDGLVNARDVKIVLANMDRAGVWSDGDFNGDGVVNFVDYQTLEVNFGKSAPTHYATVGINLDGMADYATIGAFSDLARMFRQWGRVETPYEADETIARTADNYPLEDAGAMTYARTYPDGVYKVSWDGNADLSFTGMGSVFTVTSHVGDHWTADLKLDHAKGEILNVYVTHVDANDPLHNLHVMSPDTDYSRSATFRPVFLDKVAAFNGPIRAMDWLQTNWNPAVTWADRTSPSRFSNTGHTGVDFETVIELANTMHRDVWVNVPYHADDEFVRNMAALFKAKLDPTLKVYVEFSNEVWNTGTFQQAVDNLNIAKDDPDLTKTDDFGRSAEEAGKQMGRISSLWREAYGATTFAERVRPVFGGFIATTYWSQSALEYIANHYGPVKDYVSAISVAPYVGVPGDMKDIDDENLTAQKLFDWMHDFIDDRLVPWIRDNKALADYYGIKLYAYEGGQSLQATNGMNEELKQAAQDDPRMGGVYKHLMQAWYASSAGGMFENFSLATNYTPFGYWGALQSIDQATSVKWEAILSTIGL